MPSLLVISMIIAFEECSFEPDNDGIPSKADNCPTTYNPDQEDGDSDLVGDACDLCPDDINNDRDKDENCAGDGYMVPMTGDKDNCPEDFNPDQADADGDDVGDICDNCWDEPNPAQVDSDGDCSAFTMPYANDPKCGDACDNCPFRYNPGQSDVDGNGVGDVCDVDLTVKEIEITQAIQMDMNCVMLLY